MLIKCGEIGIFAHCRQECKVLSPVRITVWQFTGESERDTQRETERETKRGEECDPEVPLCCISKVIKITKRYLHSHDHYSNTRNRQDTATIKSPVTDEMFKN